MGNKVLIAAVVVLLLMGALLVCAVVGTLVRAAL